MIARPRTLTLGRPAKVQNKLLLDDLFDYPSLCQTIIFFSASMFRHGLIITLLSKSLLVQLRGIPKYATLSLVKFLPMNQAILVHPPSSARFSLKPQPPEKVIRRAMMVPIPSSSRWVLFKRSWNGWATRVVRCKTCLTELSQIADRWIIQLLGLPCCYIATIC